MQIDHPCAHDSCKCMVSEQGKYCSDYCRDADAARDGLPRSGECQCGHAECGLPKASAPRQAATSTVE